jgi:formamidopyrimidine-DNA glycosylase
VPELPEVEALAQDLRGRLRDHAIARVDVAAFSALKTFDPPLSAVHGLLVDDVTRHGKFLDITVSGLHLVVQIGRASCRERV